MSNKNQNHIVEPNKKVSSVEWLFNNLKSHFEHDGDLFETVAFSYAIAKAMHKNEIIDAVDGFPLENRNMLGEQYYEETFNQ